MYRCKNCSTALDVIEGKYLLCPLCGKKYALPKKAQEATNGQSYASQQGQVANVGGDASQRSYAAEQGYASQAGGQEYAPSPAPQQEAANGQDTRQQATQASDGQSYDSQKGYTSQQDAQQGLGYAQQGNGQDYAQGQSYASQQGQAAQGQSYAPISRIQSREWLPIPEGTTPCLKIEGLSKQYPQAARYAVKDLSLACYPGEIVGLLGHNGAGKSTTLKCLTGMLPFEKGTIEINGFDIKQEPVKAKYTFGFVSDKHDVFVKMTGVQYVNFMADAYGVSKKDRNERLVELDKVFALGDRLRDPINSYSHGMRQKVCMLGSLIHHPKLWIMDEPMIGLDPVTSARVSAFMLDYAARGNCILFSSHNISSVQRLCKRAVIINHGDKTDDFEFADFMAQHPDVNLEDYFLSRTEGLQQTDGDGEVDK